MSTMFVFLEEKSGQTCMLQCSYNAAATTITERRLAQQRTTLSDVECPAVSFPLYHVFCHAFITQFAMSSLRSVATRDFFRSPRRFACWFPCRFGCRFIRGSSSGNFYILVFVFRFSSGCILVSIAALAVLLFVPLFVPESTAKRAVVNGDMSVTFTFFATRLW